MLWMRGRVTCVMQLRVKVLGKSLLIHLLKADDVSVEAQQLLQDKRPAIVRIKEPTDTLTALRVSQGVGKLLGQSCHGVMYKPICRDVQARSQ